MRNLTDGFDDSQHLSSWATELQGLIKSPNRLLYPTDHSSMNIPHDVITEDTCQTARELCSSIVSCCQAFINKWYKPFTISAATTISNIQSSVVIHVTDLFVIDCVIRRYLASQYACDANRDFQLHDVRNLTDGFDDSQHLSSWATELQGLIKSPNRLLYPTEHSCMNIPHDVITEDTCQTARELCSSIVSWCQAFINKWYKPFTISRATTISSIQSSVVIHVTDLFVIDCVIRC